MSWYVCRRCAEKNARAVKNIQYACRIEQNAITAIKRFVTTVYSPHVYADGTIHHTVKNAWRMIYVGLGLTITVVMNNVLCNYDSRLSNSQKWRNVGSCPLT